MEFAWTIALWGVAAAWSLVTLVGLLGHFGLRRLREASASEATGEPPRVSVIVPSRDEAERVERTVRGLLAQREVAVQVVAVDDRSTDETSQILAEIAAEDPRLEVVRVEAVPEGWLGKCHACRVGAEQATGDWLLFLDADSWLDPQVVARAIAQAQADEADHLCLVPGLGPCTLVGQAAVSILTLGLLGIALGVNRDWRFSYVGVGAFTLMKRDAYDRIGGHGGVRLQVIEDFSLGYLVRRAGLRSRLYDGIAEVEVRWAHSAPSMMQVLEKNLFAKLGFSKFRAVCNVLLVWAIWALPLSGPFLGSAAGWAALIAMGGSVVPASMVAARHGWSPIAGILAPLTLPLLAVATARSAWITVCQGGVRWRDTFYPLALLRSHRVGID